MLHVSDGQVVSDENPNQAILDHHRPERRQFQVGQAIVVVSIVTIPEWYD